VASATPSAKKMQQNQYNQSENPIARLEIAIVRAGGCG
jgi:hypothetical protein